MSIRPIGIVILVALSTACGKEPPAVSLSARSSVAPGSVPLVADISYKGDPSELKFHWETRGANCSATVSQPDASSAVLNVGNDCAGKTLLATLTVTSPNGAIEKTMDLKVQAATSATSGSSTPTPTGSTAAPQSDISATPPTSDDPQKGGGVEVNFAGKQIKSFGIFGAKCSIPGGKPTMELKHRPANGDFALCCVVAAPRLQLKGVKKAVIDFELAATETQLDFKFENVHPDYTETSWISSHESFKEGRHIVTREFDPSAVSDEANHFCFGVVGPGPATNTFTIHSMALQ